jgi:hypothetical protein
MAFFAACCALFTHAGVTGERVRLWPLSVTTAGGPVLVLAALSAGFVVVAGAQLVADRRLAPRELVLGETFLVAPKNAWTRTTLCVARDTVRTVTTSDWMGTRLVTIVFCGGKLVLSNRHVGNDGIAAVLAWAGYANMELPRCADSRR